MVYGIDALLDILDQKIPFIKAMGNFAPLKWVLKRIYKLFSFNRKVIVAKKCGPASIDCSPDQNYLYRFIFMAVCLVFNTLMLYFFQNNFNRFLIKIILNEIGVYIALETWNQEVRDKATAIAKGILNVSKFFLLSFV